MSTTNDEERREARNYQIGFGAAVVLTALPFLLVWTGALPRAATLAAISALALVQVVVQVRYFLHIDFSRQKREDLQLILFSTLVLILVAGGTVWVLSDLGHRMGVGMGE